ncbi:MAG TPA: C-GCAxxG-C-C family protein [Terriglobia bacterium]|nr:C-GCAxxG-C-C family protein [Terriglobia bacterium]
MKNHALERFRRPPERMNCAEAVLCAYREVSGDTAIAISEMKRLGSGRAPGGLCGALHAACTVAPDKAERLKARFAEIAGSAVCKEIRRAKQHPCEFCVSEAAELLESELQLNRPEGPQSSS